jgi:hypothetical protein
MKQHHVIAITPLLAMLLGACQTVPDASDKPQGKSRAYTEGYSDGCQSGHFAAGEAGYKLAKDVTRFNYDTQYVTGWNEGFGVCKGAARPAAQ